MDEKLKSDLQKHRDKKAEQKARLEKHRANRVRILDTEPKLAMMFEAAELQTLSSVAKRMADHCETRGLHAPDVKELVRAAKRMRSAAIVRWIIAGMSNKDVAEVFQMSTVRIAQIKTEVLGPKQNRKLS